MECIRPRLVSLEGLKALQGPIRRPTRGPILGQKRVKKGQKTGKNLPILRPERVQKAEKCSQKPH